MSSTTMSSQSFTSARPQAVGEALRELSSAAGRVVVALSAALRPTRALSFDARLTKAIRFGERLSDAVGGGGPPFMWILLGP